MTSSVLQSRKWQLIGMSLWCRSALCGHLLPALTDNWTHGAASRHTIAPISHTRPSPRSHSYYSFPVPLRVGGRVVQNDFIAMEISAQVNEVNSHSSNSAQDSVITADSVSLTDIRINNKNIRSWLASDNC